MDTKARSLAVVGVVVMALTCGAFAQPMRTVYRREFNNTGPGGSACGALAQPMRTVYRREFNNTGPGGSTIVSTVVTVTGDNGTSAFLGNVGGYLGNTRGGRIFTRAGDASTMIGLGSAASNHVGDPWGATTTLIYEGGVSWGTGELGSAVGTAVGGPVGTVVGGVAAHLATRGINSTYTHLTTPYGLPPGWRPQSGPVLPRNTLSYYGSRHGTPEPPIVVNINATHPGYVHSTYNTGPQNPIVIKITPTNPSGYTPRPGSSGGCNQQGSCGR